jgi:alpha-tubulin suppressor-like RCC1 family protein
VSNAAGFVDSAVSKLRVCEAIVVQPISGGGDVFVGKGMGLGVVAGPSASGPFKYQWVLDGKDIVGATAASYAVEAVSSVHGGTYTVRVSSTDTAVPAATSSGVVVKVVEAPVVEVQPVSRYVAVGMTHSVSAKVRGTAPMSYQWYRKLKGSSGEGEAIAGATSTTYTLPAMVKDVDGVNTVAGDYWMSASNEYGTVTTQAARLWEGGPEIVRLTDEAGAIPGPAGANGTLVFRAEIRCVGTLGIKWKRGTGELVHNMTSNALDSALLDVVSIVTTRIGDASEGLWESVLTISRATPVSSGTYAVEALEVLAPQVIAVRQIGPVTVSTAPAQVQTITFGGVANRKVGDVPFEVSAVATSKLDVTVDVLSGGDIVEVGGASGKQVTLKEGKTGLVVLRATQAGNAAWKRALPVTRAFFVMPADGSAYQKLAASRHRDVGLTANNYNCQSHVLGIRFDGTMWAWGLNDAGQLGTGDTVNKIAPQPVMAGKTWLDVSAGESFTLAVDKEGELWAWGVNNVGQLGTGTGRSTNVPVKVGNQKGWLRVYAGRTHGLGIRQSEGGVRELWAWGGNGRGQLGNGSTQNAFAPVRVGGVEEDWVSASAGDQHSLGIRAKVAGESVGELLTWGANEKGQLGSGGMVDRVQPGVVGSGLWSVVDGGVQASAGISSTGQLYTWGSGDSGKLGQGFNVNTIEVPTLLGSVKTLMFKSVSYGRSHIVALTTGGQLWAWGNNAHKQSGGPDPNQYVPNQVPLYTQKAGVKWLMGVGGNQQSFFASNSMTMGAMGYGWTGELGFGFLDESWYTISGGTLGPGPRFEVISAPPARVEVGTDGSLTVSVALLQSYPLPTTTKPVVTWTGDGAAVETYGAVATSMAYGTDYPGLQMPDGSQVAIYTLNIPAGSTKLPSVLNFNVKLSFKFSAYSNVQTMDFSFPPIRVK